MPNPLGPEHRDEIDRHLAALKDAKADIDRAKLAGIDVSDLEASLRDTEARLLKLKAAYFPTRTRG